MTGTAAPKKARSYFAGRSRCGRTMPTRTISSGASRWSTRITRPRLAELELARKLLPDQEAIRMALGRVYQALGRAAEAKAEFAEVRRLKAAVIERDRQRVESDALMKQ